MARLPAAPGAYGQPPRPPADASNVVMPNGSAVSTLARAVPRVSWKCSATWSAAHARQHRVEHDRDLARMRDPDCVADGDFEHAKVDEARRDLRDALGRHDPFERTAERR